MAVPADAAALRRLVHALHGPTHLVVFDTIRAKGPLSEDTLVCHAQIGLRALRQACGALYQGRFVDRRDGCWVFDAEAASAHVRALCAAIAAEGAHPDAAVPEFSCATCQRRVALVDALDEVTAAGAPPACCGAPMVERVGEKAAAARDARELMRGLNP